MKKTNGITLISLIIIIVILLLLAGITLGIITGDNGIFNKAILAKQEYYDSKIEEENQLEALSNEIDSVVGNRNDNLADSVSLLNTRVTNLENSKLILQTGTISQQTFSATSGKTITITLPQEMKDTNYLVSIKRISCGYAWSFVEFNISTITSTGFDINGWNNGSSAAYTGLRWSVIGELKEN